MRQVVLRLFLGLIIIEALAIALLCMGFPRELNGEKALLVNALFTLMAIFTVGYVYRFQSELRRMGFGGVPAEGLSLADLMEEICEQGHTLSSMLVTSQERLEALEKHASNSHGAADPVFRSYVEKASRMYGVLESHFSKIKALAGKSDAASLLEAKFLLGERIKMPAAVLNELTGTRETRPRTLLKWGRVLDSLLSLAETRLEDPSEPRVFSARG